jgi:hypothetical protein
VHPKGWRHRERREEDYNGERNGGGPCEGWEQGPPNNGRPSQGW